MIKNLFWNIWARFFEIGECFMFLGGMIIMLLFSLVLAVPALLFKETEHDGKPVRWNHR